MNQYDDIINLPRWEPKNHARMSLKSRASQFAPFSALSGYDSAIKETARIIDGLIVLDEISLKLLNRKLSYLKSIINKHPEIEVSYCLPDGNREGYYTHHIHRGNIRRIEDFENMFVFEDGKNISIHSVFDIKGNFMPNIDESF